MIRIYNLTELTLPGFLLRGLIGRQPYVLAVDPLLPPLRDLLQRIAERMVRASRARWIIDLVPELNHVWEYPTRILLYNIFAETEAWQNRRYRFADFDRGVPDYAMACRQVTCNFTRLRHFPWLLLATALRDRPRGSVRVIGLPNDSREGLETWQGRSFASSIGRTAIPRAALNAAIAVAVTGYALAWILSRLRLNPPAPEAVFFAADYLEDPKDMQLYDEVAEGGSVLLVVRDPSRKIAPYPRLARFPACKPVDGRFGPRAAAAAAGVLLRDSWRLWRHGRWAPPPLFYQIAALPWRRAVLRAFFARFRPRFYWGRDDYNVEHILRRDELHRAGGISLGINHGYPAYACVFPMWRYISFDRYYVFGRALYERYMKDSWATDMTVVPVGTYMPTRGHFARRFRPRSKDIVVFSAVLVGDPRMVAVVRALAAAYPDRMLFLQVKHLFVDTENGRRFIAACREGLPNVVHVRDSVYDLFDRAGYAFSDPSTVVVEALQFGVASFCIDVCDYQRTSLLRDFPTLCVRGPDDAVRRIRDMETGTVPYRRGQYAELIDLSGRIPFDVVREDVGLPAREAPMPLAEAI